MARPARIVRASSRALQSRRPTRARCEPGHRNQAGTPLIGWASWVLCVLVSSRADGRRGWRTSQRGKNKGASSRPVSACLTGCRPSRPNRQGLRSHPQVRLRRLPWFGRSQHASLAPWLGWVLGLWSLFPLLAADPTSLSPRRERKREKLLRAVSVARRPRASGDGGGGAVAERRRFRSAGRAVSSRGVVCGAPSEKPRRRPGRPPPCAPSDHVSLSVGWLCADPASSDRPPAVSASSHGCQLGAGEGGARSTSPRRPSLALLDAARPLFAARDAPVGWPQEVAEQGSATLRPPFFSLIFHLAAAPNTTVQQLLPAQNKTCRPRPAAQLSQHHLPQAALGPFPLGVAPPASRSVVFPRSLALCRYLYIQPAASHYVHPCRAPV